MDDPNEPAERSRHSTVVIKDLLYLWGGWQKNLPKVHSSDEKERLTSHVHAFHCKLGEWTRHGTVGHPPLGVSHYASTSINRTIFYFAGYCGHDDCDHNSLTALNVDDFSWTTLFRTSDDVGPMRKSGCGLVALNGQLLVLGGVSYSAPKTPRNPPTPFEEYKSLFYTNEHHLFDMAGAEWSIPDVTGDTPPPASDFSFKKISADQGVMFGGYGPNGFSSELRVATVQRGSVHWERVAPSGPDCPKGKSVHATAYFTLLGDGTQSLHLMILGGRPVGDAWICNMNNWLWKKVTNIPESLVNRWYHSIAVIGAGDNCVWIMVVGGLKSTSLSNFMSPVVLLELSINASGEWKQTSIRQRREIYDGYWKRFFQTFFYKPVQEQSERQGEHLEQQVVPGMKSPVSVLLASLREKEDLLETVREMSQGKDAQIQKLERDIEAKDTKISELQLQLSDAESDIEAKDTKISELQLQLSDAESIVSELKKACEFLKIEKENLKEKVHILEGRHNEEYEATITHKEQMAEEITRLKQQLDDKDTEVDQQVKERDEYVYQLKRTIEVKIAEYEAVNKLKKALAGEVTQLKQELEKAKRPLLPKGLYSTCDSSTQASFYLPETEASLDSSPRAAVQHACVQADYLALIDDSMLAAEVLAETVIEVTGDGHQSLSWSGQGLRLTVPAGAVPTGATISLAIKSLLSGEFELPDGCQLVSAIYWIKASQPFNKNVILHLHHCGVIESEERCSRYKFVAGRCSQPNLPYKLVKRDGGVFTQHTHEASISVKQFSFNAVVSDEDSELSYTGQAFYRPVEEVYAWQFDYVITKDIPSLVEKVQEHYNKRGWTEHHEQLLEFEESKDGSEESITLSVERGSQDDEWKITQVTPNQITKRKVDRMRRESNPPHCLMAVDWKGKF